MWGNLCDFGTGNFIFSGWVSGFFSAVSMSVHTKGVILYSLGSVIQNHLLSLSLITPHVPFLALDAANCAPPPFYSFLRIIKHLNSSCSFSQVTDVEL